jgi:hypothetical protein
MLFIGCCAVSVTPAVWEWKRITSDRGSFAPYRSFRCLAQNSASSAKLCYLLEEVVVDVPEERKPGRKRVHIESTSNSALDIRESVGKRERELLGCSGSGFANVIARNRNGIPLRHVFRGPLEAIDYQSKRRLDGIHPCVLRMYSFRMSF